MNKLTATPARIDRWKGVVLAILSLAAVGLLFAFFFSSPDAATLAKHASEAFMDRRFGEAEADLAQLRRLRAPTAFDWMMEGQLAIYKGKTDEALTALAKVPDDYPMAAQARLEAGQLELRRSRYVAAEKLLLEAIKLDPKSVQARRELVYIYGMQLRRPEINANFRELARISTLTYSEVFLWCLSRGVSWEVNEVIATLKKCLEADPNDSWARLGIAEGLRELRRFDEADSILAPLPDSDPRARATRVRLALDRGDDQAAETLLAAGPSDDVDLTLLRGRFALARGDGPEAVRQFRIAHEEAPSLREAVIGLGQSLQSIGDSAAAAPLLEEARKHERLGTLIVKASALKNRDDPALMRDLGEACAALGRFTEARTWYNLAITRDPFDIQAQDGIQRVKELEARAQSPGPK